MTQVKCSQRQGNNRQLARTLSAEDKVHYAKIVVAQILPEPQASLLTGILLGDDSGIPKYVQDAFRTTGTSHLIAISG